MAEEECIFCKIAKGELPASKVYEDRDFVAFLDIMPANKGHVLLVPKKHYTVLDEMPPKIAEGMIMIEHKISKAIMKALNPDGYNCLQNNHVAAGQLVPHAHVHIIPRYNSDKFRLDWPHKTYEGKEMDDFVSRIKKAL
jgi:histidine triad (HIT) family protein